MTIKRYRSAIFLTAKITILLVILYFVGRYVLLHWNMIDGIPLPNICWLAMGTVFGLCAYALVAVFTVAQVVGFLAVFAQAGIGVREGVR